MKIMVRLFWTLAILIQKSVQKRINNSEMHMCYNKESYYKFTVFF